VSAIFTKALEYLFQNEGGYVDDPLDSGGATNMGVTLKFYSLFKQRMVSIQELKDLTPEQAGDFYEAEYWNPIHGDTIIDSAMATAIFDTAVLYGVDTSVEMAQRAIKATGFVLKTDGIMGPLTLAFLNSMDRSIFLRYFYQFIILYIEEIVRANPKNEVFARGWTLRAERLLSLQGETTC
jgi:lysozyme family protein